MGELGQRMSNAEFVEWSVFHGRKAQRQEMAHKRAQHGRGR